MSGGAGEPRHRELRLVQAGEMAEAADKVRELGGPNGYAGLDKDSADALAALIEVIAGGAREKSDSRVWEQASRAARRILEPDVNRAAGPAGPLPDGYESRGREPFADTPQPQQYDFVAADGTAFDDVDTVVAFYCTGEESPFGDLKPGRTYEATTYIDVPNSAGWLIFGQSSFAEAAGYEFEIVPET